VGLWTVASALFSGVLLLTLFVYRETVASIVAVWIHSETFTHGFLILPISAYLAWTRRETLARLTPGPHPPALLFLLPIGLAWLAGHATNTRLVEQLSLVAFIPALAWILFGTAVVRSIAFPLAFLVFAVPFGDTFRPVLMDATATIAVGALNLSGVPIVREGVLLTTTVGRWRIAEACSGLNYLVSGVALACLFAYVTYRTTWKRIVCVATSIVVLVLANGARAYTLILVGYLSEMRLGRGFAHYAFGWVVYILVMVAFFAVCSRFRDDALPASAGNGPKPDPGPAPSPHPGQWMAVAGAAAAIVAFWPPLLSYLDHAAPAPRGIQIAAPAPRGGWEIQLVPDFNWRPAFAGATSEAVRIYVKNGEVVQCHLEFYELQSDAGELITQRNVIIDPHDPRWRDVGERDQEIESEGNRFAARETDVRGPDGRILVWQWYWFPDEFTAGRVWGKFLQARARFIVRRNHAAVVVLSAVVPEGRDTTTVLRRFAGDMLPSIREAIEDADRTP
jgi:exosortase A